MNNILYKAVPKINFADRINFIKNNFNLFVLPLNESDKLLLKSYKENNEIVDEKVMLSIMNLMRSQREINVNKLFNQNRTKYINHVNELIDNITVFDTNSIRDFIIKSNLPITLLVKIVNNKILLTELKNIIKEQNNIQTIIANNAKNYEIEFSNFLKTSYPDIKFLTENEIKKLPEKYKSTPDFLFENPVTINNKLIKWIDVKNFPLIDIPFIIKKLNEQGNKYNNEFGNGAFVFSYGVDSNVKLDENIMILSHNNLIF